MINNKKQKSVEEWCEEYFKEYNKNYDYRKVWLLLRKRRYCEIKNNDFYLDKNAETFKKEVLQFWEGKDGAKGWSYRNSKIRKKNGGWINFQDGNGETPNSEEVIKELEKNNLELHGNYSWSRLDRGGDITNDMEKLERTVKYLFDESIDIVKRFDKAMEIVGMGRNKISAFLHIKYPDKYGVWNSCTEKAFKILSENDLRFKIKGANNGAKYKKINEQLKWLLRNYNCQKYKNGFENLSDVDIFVWYVAN